MKTFPKALTVSLIFGVCVATVVVAGEYDTSYCRDSEELQKWDNLLQNNPESEAVAAIHALWIGLCIKVEAQQLTTIQANQLFDRFRDSLIEQIKHQADPPVRDKIQFNHKTDDPYGYKTGTDRSRN